jgi:protein subunit release factor B
MAEDSNHFQTRLYEETQQLFPEGEVEALVARSLGPGSKEPPSPAVRLIHKPTGIAVDCEQFQSQTQNCILATIRLRIACDEKRA